MVLAGGDINAQSNPDDMDPPAPSSIVTASTSADDVDILLGGGGLLVKTKCGGLQARITSLSRDI